jgi:tetratricopeptide (TPR) repeat protein/tRNA A-37 threonylcarbamoyl transferase component Bud32
MAVDNDPQRSFVSTSLPAEPQSQQSTPFPETVTSPGGPAKPSPAGLPPSRYQPIQFHAAGGLGEVLRAQDPELNREVALKRIQERHADNPESRRRFLREAEITGRLEHPGVVPVHGLGQDADGRPCYAMRFIQGESLKDAIQKFHAAEKEGKDPGERRLAFRQLLTSFVSVCKTMAYAHSRGVLHRDLKPANIMLGKYGETLVVDWGLAKAFDRDDEARALGEASLQPQLEGGGSDTQTGATLGTPVFMSPEQSAGDKGLVGPASDIYSLGATLYYLLTNALPYDIREPYQMRAPAILAEVVPPRQRKKNVPRALEAICLKAMAKEQQKRYGTALELAGDVEHWLADEPVMAYREPTLGRLRRWGRRHRPLVASAAVLLATITAALAIGLGVVNGEKNRTLAALAAEQDALAAEQAARAAEQLAKETAQARETETRAVLDFFEKRVFAAGRPKNQEGGQGYDVKLADAIKAALPFVDKSFTGQPRVEAHLRTSMGLTFMYLGKPEKAIEQFQAASALFTAKLGPDHPATLHSMSNLANSYSAAGRTQEALKLREETLQLTKSELGPYHPDTLQSMGNLATSYSAAGRTQEALKLREETLRLLRTTLGPDHPSTVLSMSNLAVSYTDAGRFQEAIKLHEERLQLLKSKLGPDHPDTLQSMINLTSSYALAGRTQEALQLREETLPLMKATLGPDHASTLLSMSNLANSYAAAGRAQEALQLRQETLQLQKAALGPDHPDTLKTMNNLTNSYAAAGRTQEALQLSEETLQLTKSKLGPDHPDTLLRMNNLAEFYIAMRQLAKAVAILQETLTLRQRRLHTEPGNSLQQSFLAWTHGQIGDSEVAQGDDAAALRAYATSVEMFDKLDQAGTLKQPFFRVRMNVFHQRLTLCRKAEQAVKDLDFTLRQPAEEVLGLLEMRVRHLLKEQKLAAALESAAKMKERAGENPYQVYIAARTYALCAGTAKNPSSPSPLPPGARAETLAEEALALLKQAVAKGLDAGLMKGDRDLDSLRERQDFKKLLADLETKGKREPK